LSSTALPAQFNSAKKQILIKQKNNSIKTAGMLKQLQKEPNLSNDVLAHKKCKNGGKNKGIAKQIRM